MLYYELLVLPTSGIIVLVLVLLLFENHLISNCLKVFSVHTVIKKIYAAFVLKQVQDGLQVKD